MQSKEHYKKEIKCFGCKKIGHYARNCPTLFCKLCNIKGHTSENCRSKKKTVMTPASNHDRAKALKDNNNFLVQQHISSTIVLDSKHSITVLILIVIPLS